MPNRIAAAAAVVVALLAGTLARAAAAEAPVLPSATGKVAVEGALTANDLTPSVGSVIYVYFNVTPLESMARLELRLRVPPTLVPVAGDASLTRAFDRVEAGRTVTLIAPLRIMKRGEQTIAGAAQLLETRDLALARSFLLVLNPSPVAAAAAERGTNSRGEKVIIYGESPSPTPSPSPRPPTERR